MLIDVDHQRPQADYRITPGGRWALALHRWREERSSQHVAVERDARLKVNHREPEMVQSWLARVARVAFHVRSIARSARACWRLARVRQGTTTSAPS